MTLYEIQNDKGEVFAVVVKCDDRVLVKYSRTCFESMDQVGAYLNADLSLHEVKGTHYERSTEVQMSRLSSAT